LGATGLEPVTLKSEDKLSKSVTKSLEIPLAHSLARQLGVCADLARVIDAWPTLPAAIRRGILAMIETVFKESYGNA
jgi:hypothetical protein